MSSTHIMTVSIGIDFGKYLDKDNIKGVMTYLNVNDEQELLQKIGQDKFNTIADLLEKEGYEVLDGKIDAVPEQVEETETKTEENAQAEEYKVEQLQQPSEYEEVEVVDEPTIHAEPQQNVAHDLNDVEKGIINKIKTFQREQEEKGLATIFAVEIAEELKQEVPSIELIKHEVDFVDGVTVEYVPMRNSDALTIKYLTSAGKQLAEIYTKGEL